MAAAGKAAAEVAEAADTEEVAEAEVAADTEEVAAAEEVVAVVAAWEVTPAASAVANIGQSPHSSLP